jgi:hypothetical protein
MYAEDLLSWFCMWRKHAGILELTWFAASSQKQMVSARQYSSVGVDTVN